MELFRLQSFKGQKRYRLVLDYRKLNLKTVDDVYPLPNITETLDQLGNPKYFSVVDLVSELYQVIMHDKVKEKTDFSAPGEKWDFNRCLIGVENSPSTFTSL